MAQALESVVRGVIRFLIASGSISSPQQGQTWSPALSDGNVTFSNGNKTAEVTAPPGSGQAWYYSRTAAKHATGKYYFEAQIEAVSNGMIGALGDQYGVAVGVIKDSKDIATIADNEYPGQNSYSAIADGSSSWRWNGGTFFLLNIDWDQAGERLGIAVDLDAGKLWFRDSGGYDSGDPAAGTSPSISGISTGIDWALMCMVGANTGDTTKSKITGAFASADWVFGAPGGFVQW